MAYKRRQRRRRQRGGNIDIQNIKKVAYKAARKGRKAAYKVARKGRAKLNSLIKRAIKTKRHWSSLGNKKQKGGLYSKHSRRILGLDHNPWD